MAMVHTTADRQIAPQSLAERTDGQTNRIVTIKVLLMLKHKGHANIQKLNTSFPILLEIYT
jgi:hypothetical protein